MFMEHTYDLGLFIKRLEHMYFDSYLDFKYKEKQDTDFVITYDYVSDVFIMDDFYKQPVLKFKPYIPELNINNSKHNTRICETLLSLHNIVDFDKKSTVVGMIEKQNDVKVYFIITNIDDNNCVITENKYFNLINNHIKIVDI